jgi:hypothetical protein
MGGFLQSCWVLLVEVIKTFGRIPQMFQWFPGVILRSITLLPDEVLQALTLFVEAYLQHLCNLVEVYPIHYIWRGRIVMVLIGSDRRNPGTKEYGVEDQMNLPQIGKFKFVRDGSNLADDREGTITPGFKFLHWVVSDQIRFGQIPLITGFIVGVCLSFGVVEPLHCLLCCPHGSPCFLSNLRHPGCKLSLVFGRYLEPWFSAFSRMESHGNEEGTETCGLADLVFVVELR